MTRPLQPEPEPPGLPSLPAAPEEEVEEVTEGGRPQSSPEGRGPLRSLPSRKVSGLTSVQLLQLCWIPLLVSLAPMVVIIMLYMKFDDVLPDDTMARSFNEDNMPTGFTSPLKYTMKMLSLCIMLQTIFTFCGVMLNPVRSRPLLLSPCAAHATCTPASPLRACVRACAWLGRAA
jgi:hypothetical protein